MPWPENSVGRIRHSIRRCGKARRLFKISSSLIHTQPFTEAFPRADIYELLSPDLLHQVIKGTFKDHIVTWVHEYLTLVHGERRANKIIDEIDQRYVMDL